MHEVLVRGERVAKSFGAGKAKVQALAPADFEVFSGDRIALVGPSGSGKTTLLHLVSAIDTPTSGSMSWPGIGSARQLRPSCVTIAFQGPSLLPALSVRENVALPLLLGGDAEATADLEAESILARLGLDELADRLPEELSGGQAQRVALARALVVKPVLLLADEPTGQQDSVHGQALVHALLDLADQEAITVIVATHDESVAHRLDRRWVMESGRLSVGGA
jgi:ABC-type lipoprotein export system ATPase subunit